MTGNLFYIASVCGALAVYMMLPRGQRAGRYGAAFGAVLGAATLGALFITLGRALYDSGLPDVYYYLFTFIALAAAVRVITHTRPVYSALYFILVVLATSGMLVMLQAEFMAFAMVIIYGGAILVTYMFVIMLATMPQSNDGPDISTPYDRVAREPLMAVVMGFLLVAVLGQVIFSNQKLDRPDVASPAEAAAQMPGKFRVNQLETLLRSDGLIANDESITPDDVDLAHNVILVRSAPGVRPRRVEITDEMRGQFVSNIDYVGLNLFEGHTLGIELAGVVLLLSMVGAIVIARQQVPREPGDATLDF